MLKIYKEIKILPGHKGIYIQDYKLEKATLIDSGFFSYFDYFKKDYFSVCNISEQTFYSSIIEAFSSENLDIKCNYSFFSKFKIHYLL